MTSRRTPYLDRRGSMYYLRIPVPKPLHAKLRCKEVRRSLKTSNRELAIRLVKTVSLEFDRLCWKISAMTETRQTNIHAVLEELHGPGSETQEACQWYNVVCQGNDDRCEVTSSSENGQEKV